MLIDETSYLWKKGDALLISLEEETTSIAFDNAEKIYLMEGTGTVSVFADTELAEAIYSGALPFEPESPIACNGLTVITDTFPSELTIIGETGIKKTVLTPYLNTTENMTAVSSSYNDDGYYAVAGLSDFMFAGVAASTIYVSSNHYIGFGSNTEHLKICRRDGCSTAIYSQIGELDDGRQFLKIRFEGYTVYNNRIEAYRLIYELFLLSTGNMFLNVIQTPTSGYTGTSELVCNGTTTPLTLHDSAGGVTYASFYCGDDTGSTWDVQYAMYEDVDTYSYAYLIKQGELYFTISDGALVEVPIENLTAGMFLKYGFDELPDAELITPLENPEFFYWRTGGDEKLIKANLIAYPYPSTIVANVDMSHISILGISLMTAEYSGQVGLKYSFDNGESFSEEQDLGDWLNTDVEELWNCLPEDRLLILHFILHDNATLSRFKITYTN